MFINFIKSLKIEIEYFTFLIFYNINKLKLNLNAYILPFFNVIDIILIGVLFSWYIPLFFFFSNFVYNTSWLILIYLFLIFVLVYIVNLHSCESIKSIATINFATLCFLVLSLIIFICCIINAQNFIALYCGLEGLSLTTLFFLSRNFFKTGAKEVFLKYFCFSTFSSILLLSGISLIYSITFSLDFLVVRLTIFKNILTINNYTSIFYLLYYNFFIILMISSSLLLLSFFFKIGAFPFHFILPDLYNQTSILFLIFYVFILKPIYILTTIYLFYNVFFDISTIVSSLFVIGGFGSILIGTFSALGQLNIFRLLGYSSIIQVGFILLAFSVNTTNVLVILFFLLCYLMTFFIFLSSYLLLKFSIPENLAVFSPTCYLGSFAWILDQMKSNALSHTFAYTGYFGIIFSFLSNAALPPFIGFFSKYLLILTFIQKENIYFLFIVLLINIIVAYFYIYVAYSLFTQVTFKNYNNKNTFINLYLNKSKPFCILATLYHIIYLYVLILFLCFPFLCDTLLTTLILPTSILLLN